ncbi:MAG: APC family permease [Thermoplasmatales archaeon]|jgi:amino acid transporter|nr:APC family permease [Candidatus Thermoplasmatota archaeon]MCL6003442.1 APC family permease [Candidatus Thermoplasmatota archaeon]MDA8055793.1 APC family permease [Thermoplasmatales archaeon]
MTNELNRSGLSFWQLVFWAVAVMFPASAFAITGSTAMAYSGPVAPMAFLIGGIMLLAAIVSVYYYSKKVATPGGYYKFVERSVPNKYFSKTVGFLQILYMSSAMPFTSILGGWLLWSALMALFNISLPLYVVILASLIGPVLYLVVGYRSVSVGGNLAIIISMFEIAIFGAISIALIAISPNNNISYFNIGNSWGGLSGFFTAVVVGGFMSYSGYGGIVMFGEETKTPFRTIKNAIVAAAVIIIGIEILEVYSVVSIAGSSLSTALSYFSPGFYFTEKYLGGGVLLVSFIVIEIAQIMAPVFNGSQTARIFLSLSRDRVLPESLSRVHPKYKSPYVAVLTIFTFTVVLTVLSLIVFVHFYGMNDGTFYAWLLFGTFLSVLWWLYHLIVNQTLAFLYRRLTELKILPHIIVPTISSILFLIGGYYSVLGLAWPISLVYYVIPIWVVFGIIFTYINRKKILTDKPLEIEKASAGK